MTEEPQVEGFEFETEMTRELGMPSVLAIGVGTMIAAGIFTLSGLAVGYVGSAAIVSFLLAAVVATFTALTYCEFTSIYPQSGEGYLYARKTFTPPLAYMVGWCLFLGYATSCGFYISSLASYFNEFIWHLPFEMMAGLAALAGLTLLNIKGTKESGSFQIVVTIAKVGLLIWFIAGGLSHVSTEMIVERFNSDILEIGSTAALVFITFFGFSAIAASAGEVKNPTKTIPRAIFISMIVVTILYSFVVLVVLAANLTEYNEAAMGSAARLFLGPIGGLVIVAGAIFSMVAASNASIMAGSRVALAMSRLGHLPKEIGIINAQTRTPVVAIILVAMVIGGSATALPLEELAHFADCVLLIALILVNIALIIHRRKYPDIERPFRVPFVPVLPAMGIVANIYLLSRIPELETVLLASGALLLGFLGFLAWKGTQAEPVALPGAASRVALEQASTSETEFKVLVPIANPANVEQLIDMASAVAKKRNGEIIALRVVAVPEQLPLYIADDEVDRERAILDIARKRAQADGTPVTSLVRIGHNPAKAILETARERHCDLIVLGWKGYASTTRHILGEVSDTVVNHARADIMLVKLPTGSVSFKNVLLPTAGGEHAIRAAEYAAEIVGPNNGSITLCSVVSPDDTTGRTESETERLNQLKADMASDVETKTTVLRHGSVEDGIIEAAQDYDAVVVGAAGQSFSSQILFGNIPENIARNTDRPVIVIKHYNPVKALVGRVMTE